LSFDKKQNTVSIIKTRVIIMHVIESMKSPPPRWYHYFDVVVGLVWSNDAEEISRQSVATGRVTHGVQIEGEDPDKKGYPGAPCFRVGRQNDFIL